MGDIVAVAPAVGGTEIERRRNDDEPLGPCKAWKFDPEILSDNAASAFASDQIVALVAFDPVPGLDSYLDAIGGLFETGDALPPPQIEIGGSPWPALRRWRPPYAARIGRHRGRGSRRPSPGSRTRRRISPDSRSRYWKIGEVRPLSCRIAVIPISSRISSDEACTVAARWSSGISSKASNRITGMPWRAKREPGDHADRTGARDQDPILVRHASLPVAALTAAFSIGGTDPLPLPKIF